MLLKIVKYCSKFQQLFLVTNIYVSYSVLNEQYEEHSNVHRSHKEEAGSCFNGYVERVVDSPREFSIKTLSIKNMHVWLLLSNWDCSGTFSKR